MFGSVFLTLAATWRRSAWSYKHRKTCARAQRCTPVLKPSTAHTLVTLVSVFVQTCHLHALLFRHQVHKPSVVRAVPCSALRSIAGSKYHITCTSSLYQLSRSATDSQTSYWILTVSFQQVIYRMSSQRSCRPLCYDWMAIHCSSVWVNTVAGSGMLNMCSHT